MDEVSEAAEKALGMGEVPEEVRNTVAQALSSTSNAAPRAHSTNPCEECDHRGIEAVVDGSAVYCDCRHGRRKHHDHFQRIHDRVPESGVPDRLRGVTLESFREAGGNASSTGAQAVYDLLARGRTRDPTHGTTHSSVCLCGPNGIGKSGLLTILAREAYRSGQTPLFVKYSDLYAAVQDGYGCYVDGDPRHELSQLRIETAQRVDVLCLDDLGDPFANPGSGSYQVPKDRRDILFRILSARHERRKPVHITANYGPDPESALQEIARQFSPRIADRVKEVCAVAPLRSPNLREAEPDGAGGRHSRGASEDDE